MGLFNHKEAQATPATAPPAQTTRTSVDSSRQSGGLFSKHRTSTSTASSNVSPVSTHTTTSTSGGLGSVFRRGNGEDASIVDARQRVVNAEQAERKADAALAQARTAVREARDHVRQLERDAEEEARLAKIKQDQARDLSNRAKPLGRKFAKNPSLHQLTLPGHG